MIKEFGKHIKNKSILILGFGKEGQSSYRFIRKLYPDKKLTIADIDPNNNAALKLKNNDPNATILLGEYYLSQIDTFDLSIIYHHL